jgi:sterol-4alpha-carboxylate 3-dehydrogenase (decarboxylating)
MEKILVTGGTGFLGSAIVKALLETKKYHITALDINPPSLGTPSYQDVTYVRASVLDIESTRRALKASRPSIVIHTVGVYHTGAARYSSEGREELFAINVTGTKNVLEAAKEFEVKGFVYTSSMAVVTDDLDHEHANIDEETPIRHGGLLYGQSKASRLSLCTYCHIEPCHPVVEAREVGKPFILLLLSLSPLPISFPNSDRPPY